MRFRKLRIALTALSLTACVLLVALWLRSYKAAATIQLDDLRVVSYKGWFHVQVFDDPGGTFAWPYRMLFKAPHLIPVFIAASLATAPWMRWRFSLRTLLIATTLVAVVLGVIVITI